MYIESLNSTCDHHVRAVANTTQGKRKRERERELLIVYAHLGLFCKLSVHLVKRIRNTHNYSYTSVILLHVFVQCMGTYGIRLSTVLMHVFCI